MQKVKISIPGFKSQINISQFTDNYENIVDGFKFYVNSKHMDNPDFWFVIENLESNSESCNVNPKNVIFLTAETIFHDDYWLKPSKNEFLNQFSKIFSNYDTNHNEIKTSPFLPWMINSNHGDSIYGDHERNYNFFKNLDTIKKTKIISIIASNKTFTKEQKLRYDFANYISEYFGKELDWYGNGVNPINEKWHGIAPYKYHIVLENKFSNNIISEKLYDSFLGLSYPIYAGAKNVSDYFHDESLKTINLNNFEESKKIIENIIEQDVYEKNYSKLLDSKTLVLEKYNLFKRIAHIADENMTSAKKKRITLKSKDILTLKYERKYRIKKTLYQTLKRSI